MDAKHLVSFARASWGQPVDQDPKYFKESGAVGDARASGITCRVCEPSDSRQGHTEWTRNVTRMDTTRDSHEETARVHTSTDGMGDAAGGRDVEADRGARMEVPNDVKPNGGFTCKAADIPLHGLLFVLADLYMKIPQCILENVSFWVGVRVPLDDLRVCFKRVAVMT